MAKDWAKDFYNSKSWVQCRQGYFNRRYGLCERCGNAAEIIHHKEYITPKNINDPNITLNWNNLEALCRECHKKEHDGNIKSIEEGLIFNEWGDVVYEDKDNT